MNWTKENINGTEVTFCKYETQYGKNTGIEYLATENEDGTFHIPTHKKTFKNVHYMGEFDNYREADEFADWAVKGGKEIFPYVCHVAHNEDNAYILYPSKTEPSIYIRVEK